MRFERELNAILAGAHLSILAVFARFRRFRGLGNPLKAPRVPPYGVREGHGMHLCRPGPWAGSGGGMGLEIRRAARRMPAADLQGSQTTAVASRE